MPRKAHEKVRCGSVMEKEGGLERVERIGEEREEGTWKRKRDREVERDDHEMKR